MKVVLTITVLAVAVSSGAERLDWMYRVEVPVQSQLPSEVRAAGRAALDTLLVRITGLEAVPRRPNVTEALNQAERFYVRYQFKTRTSWREENQEEMVLEFHFDGSAVQELVRNALLPVWIVNRPSVLLWIAIDDHGEDSLWHAAQRDEITESLFQRARERGVPIVAPLGDLRDRRVISSAVIRGGFWQRIWTHSYRYQTDAVAAIAVTGSSDGWVGRGYLWLGTDVHELSFDVESGAAAGRALVDAIANEFVRRFASSWAQAGSIPVVVSGIDSIRAYGEMLKYLDVVEVIDHVEVASVSGNVVRLNLHTPSQIDQLTSMFADENVLLPDNSSSRGQTDEVALRWVGKR